MRIAIVSCFLYFLFFTVPLQAEFYRYVDSNGVVIFTDNLDKVPIDQREDIKRFKEVKTQDQMDNEKPNDTGMELKKQDEQDAAMLLEFQSLKREKADLDKTYEDLVLKRQQLEKEGDSLGSQDQIMAHKEKADSLNRQIQEFDVRQKSFEKKAAEFNQKNTQ